jgi:gliding motility-associated-like protein
MSGKRLWWVVLGSLLWAQAPPEYELILYQKYVRVSGSAPDSVDVYVIVRVSSSGSLRDTLISSNFPFFYNMALDFSGARVIHERKFSDKSKPNYYEAITYPFTPARVNVTVRRKVGYTGEGDVLVNLINQRDTVLALRVPVRVCGPGQRSILVWDSASAAILNSQLQSIKPRIGQRWTNDTLELCPLLRTYTWSLSSPSPPSACVGELVSFSYIYSPSPGAVSPDSFVVFTQRVSDGVVESYPGLGGGGGFSLAFSRADSYRVWVRFIEKKCGCYQDGAIQGIRVHPLPVVGQIIGPDTVYVGGSMAGRYGYSVSGGADFDHWYGRQGSGGSTAPVFSPSNATSTSVTFAGPSSGCRPDTLWAVYQTANRCRDSSRKVVAVCPCRSVPPARARTREVCAGQRGAIEIPLPFPVDSLRWQYWDGSNWQNVPDNMGTGATATLYITPPLQLPEFILRARVHAGPCEVYSDPDTIRLSGQFLDRNLYSVQTPICAGDTARLNAGGDGVWLTPNGYGIFTDMLDPQASYVSAPNDTNPVRVCWVIRSQDLTRCRETAKDTLCLDITILPAQASGSFNLTPSPKVVCPGEPVSLQGTIIQGVRAEWRSSGNGTFSPSALGTTTTYLPGPGDAGGKVYLTFIVYGSCGRAEYTDSILVQSGATPQILAPNRVCENVTLTLLAPNAAAFDSLRWWQGNVQEVQNGTASLLSRDSAYQVPPSGPGVYTFTLQTFSGGCTGYDESTIEVLPAPQVSFEANPRVTTLNNPEITFTNTSQGATSFIWNFGDPNQPSVDSSGAATVTFTYIRPGRYSVVLFGQNDLGCADVYVCTDCIVILPRKVFLPNAFSPNGDGKNDVFRVLPAEEGTPFTRLEVYDRWGQLVFAGDNLPHWDGRGLDGKPLDAGTYTYKAFILAPDEGLLSHTGVVHIVR